MSKSRERRIAQVRKFNESAFPPGTPGSQITQDQLRTGGSRQPRKSVFERRSGGESHAATQPPNAEAADAEAQPEDRKVTEPD